MAVLTDPAHGRGRADGPKRVEARGVPLDNETPWIADAALAVRDDVRWSG